MHHVRYLLILVLSLFLTLGCQGINPSVTPLGSFAPKFIIPTLELLAGDLGGIGFIDGIGTASRFNNPVGMAHDSFGNFYVADSSNHTIRKITKNGIVTTLAGSPGLSGHSDGVGEQARFSSPYGVVCDSQGNVFVGDFLNSTIRKITPSGEVSTFAGSPGVNGSSDGLGISARFGYPSSLGVDQSDNIYVGDISNNTIRKITPLGLVSTLAGTAGVAGNADGTGPAASFQYPYGLTADALGNVYVADWENYSIRKITPGGVVTTIAGNSSVNVSADGVGSGASFSDPIAITINSTGDLFVTDSSLIRKVTQTGVVTTIAGNSTSGSLNGMGTAATFASPTGITVDSSDNLFIADSGNANIRKIDLAGNVTSVAGSAPSNGSSDGFKSQARFSNPDGLAIGKNGEIYVADTGNYTIRVITPAGLVSTLVGSPGVQGSVDGTGSNARIGIGIDLTLDSIGNIYFADLQNAVIRKITPQGVATQFAGPTENITSPSGLAFDSLNNLYFADNGTSIYKITPQGVSTLFAGDAVLSGYADGLGSAARFDGVAGLTIDALGNLYAADSVNNVIRKITPSGLVSTLARSPGVHGSSDGIGNAALFYGPIGVAVDSFGNVFVSDSSNHSIRKITKDGVVTTVVGTTGILGVKLGALPSSLNDVRAIAIHGDTLYLSSENSILTCPLP